MENEFFSQTPIEKPDEHDTLSKRIMDLVHDLVHDPESPLEYGMTRVVAQALTDFGMGNDAVVEYLSERATYDDQIGVEPPAPLTGLQEHIATFKRDIARAVENTSFGLYQLVKDEAENLAPQFECESDYIFDLRRKLTNQYVLLALPSATGERHDVYAGTVLQIGSFPVDPEQIYASVVLMEPRQLFDVQSQFPDDWEIRTTLNHIAINGIGKYTEVGPVLAGQQTFRWYSLSKGWLVPCVPKSVMSIIETKPSAAVVPAPADEPEPETAVTGDDEPTELC